MRTAQLGEAHLPFAFCSLRRNTISTSTTGSKPKLIRGIGLLQAASLNMSNMVGIGPFITIPIFLAEMEGPQAMLGWIVGAMIAISDGMVWSELGAAMPGSGGTYVYLREAFKLTPLSRLMPFLFIWQFIWSGPLEIASGNIGFASYLSYLWPGLNHAFFSHSFSLPLLSFQFEWTLTGGNLVAVGVGLLAVIILYRGITSIARIGVVLWAGMLLTVAWVIVSGILHMDMSRAFSFPPGAFTLNRGFWIGLGGAMLIAMYDYLGYYNICYLGDEVREPERTIPRAVIISVIAVAAIYLTMNTSLVGVLPWQQVVEWQKSSAPEAKFVFAIFMENIYGRAAATLLTVMILWTAFASIFALMLGYSRIPFAAAVDGYFFKSFARLHPRAGFPYISLLVVGALACLASLANLSAVISAAITVRIIVQFIGQIVAVSLLRRAYPDSWRPFKMWLYPLPSLIAFAGWSYVFITSGPQFIIAGLATIAVGAVLYFIWSRKVKVAEASGAN